MIEALIFTGATILRINYDHLSYKSYCKLVNSHPYHCLNYESNMQGVIMYCCIAILYG